MLIFQLIKKNIKIAILKFFEVLGYKLKGIKNTVQNNNFDSIQKFILNQI